MPEADYRWLSRTDLLSFEELTKVARAMRHLGVRRLRLTGGEPLLRQQLPRFVSMLAPLGFADLAMTTNGVLLADHAASLKQAGLQRLTVSLDSLQQQTFATLTRRDCLGAVLRGIEAARNAGFERLKLDTVLLRGVNDSEVFDLTDFAREIGAEIRFIEYMDVGGATRWSSEQVVPQSELLRRLAERYGSVQPVAGRGSAPAQLFALGNGQLIGSIASVSEPFCGDCDRLRLTADGQLLGCLYARSGADLRAALRNGDDLNGLLSSFWTGRTAQGAVDRVASSRRANFVSLEELRQDPRLEMHTRGG
jgi:GTP 3',8-cyclase